MSDDVYLDNTVTYDSYLAPEIELPQQQVIAGTAITNLNGLTGPNITLSGGTTGFSYTPAGVTITLNGVLVAANGGTGQSSYAVGDILFASGATALSKLADVATGNALISGGVTTAPLWGKIGLTTHVSGILPNANGGMVKINSAAVAPTVNDDTGAGYSVSSLWTDTVLQDGYMCMSAAAGAAVWKKVTP